MNGLVSQTNYNVRQSVLCPADEYRKVVSNFVLPIYSVDRPLDNNLIRFGLTCTNLLCAEQVGGVPLFKF